MGNRRKPDAGQSAELIRRLHGLKPSLIDLSLDRVLALLDALGGPQQSLPPVAHIAGTNGKGSTLAFARAFLEADGLRVHAYTSPHLCRFNERIVVGGSMITDADLAECLDAVLTADKRGDITFFEATTAAALLAFARTPADVTLLETGLGGRLDATNVVDRPVVTAITPIGFDHTAFLGTTLTAIAAEKAGILKAGRPAIIGPQRDEARTLLMARTAELGAQALFHGADWSLIAPDTPDTPTILRTSHATGGTFDRVLAPASALPGAHQRLNAAMGVLIADHLRPQPLSADTIARGMNAASWPGRLQRLGPGPVSRSMPDTEIWVDAAHNGDGGLVLSAFLDTLPPMPTALAFGMYQGKDAGAFLGHFAGRLTRVIAMSVDGEQPAQPASEIAESARRAGMDATIADGPENLPALLSRGEQRLVIAGSLALIGRILAANGQCPT